ncbi:MAG TPA: T9SS type A sorting domain-containing protein, partial [Bacteroidales bacterium]|nr:T9SS type A sorting domain-containing protein [Bacteroidales bacterium]
PKKINRNNEIEVYPNPARDRVTVGFESTTPAEIVVRIYDLNGKTVKHIDLGTRPQGRQDVIVSCQDIPSGTYIMQVSIGRKVSSAKFIVQ